jgi:choice-of-anchor B domain-containing protein
MRPTSPSLAASLAALCTATFAPTAPLTAQGYQCDLVGTFSNHGPFNDVWGYVAPNGKEYALLGATTGLVVVDCSNPASPIERGWFPWATSTWRDMRTYGHYVYVSSDTSNAGGFMIVNMQNPDAPVSLGIFGGAQFSKAHNVCLDVQNGRLYFAGANTGTPVYDVAANPANPPFLGYALGSGNSNYFHDIHVENGYGYGSMIYNGVLRIWDVSTFPPTALSDSQTPSTFTHNAWPSANGNLCATTDERAGGLVRIFDTTNKFAPVARGQITPNHDAIPHNAFIKDNLCHVAWYTEGYQCIDISVPTEPVIVASYDTWPGASGGFNGAWGCYPFQPSGNIYVSDISSGLFIVRPLITDLSIGHAPLQGTLDETGPYTVAAMLASSHPITGATLHYRVGGVGGFAAVPMAATAVPGQLAAAIPGQDAAVVIEYHIEATDAQAMRRSPRIGEHRFLVGTEVVHWSDDFEVNLGWTSGGTNNDWQRGSSAGRAGQSSSYGWWDPLLPTSGQNMWGNDLGTGTGNGTYLNNANCWLQSPAIPTNAVQGLRLGYRRFLSLAAGDTARVLVNGNVVFSTSSATRDGLWEWVEHDIAPFTNGQGSVVVRFELVTNGSGLAGGWSLDDVKLFTRHDCVPTVAYGSGTQGTGGLVPSLALSGDPEVGGTPVYAAAQMLPNTLAVLALNLQPADVPALGIQVLVDPVNAPLWTGAVDGSGAAAWPFPIPASPSVDGTYVYAQAVALDGGSPGGLLSATHGLRLRVCQSAP